MIKPHAEFIVVLMQRLCEVRPARHHSKCVVCIMSRSCSTYTLLYRWATTGPLYLQVMEAIYAVSFIIRHATDLFISCFKVPAWGLHPVLSCVHLSAQTSQFWNFASLLKHFFVPAVQSHDPLLHRGYGSRTHSNVLWRWICDRRWSHCPIWILRPAAFL